MPSLFKPKSNRKQWRVEMTGIVRIPLPPNVSELVPEKGLSPADVVQFIQEATDNGYLIGFEYAPDLERYAAYAQGIRKDYPNEGIRVYANGDTLAQAMAGLWVKVAYMYNYQQWTETDNGGISGMS